MHSWIVFLAASCLVLIGSVIRVQEEPAVEECAQDSSQAQEPFEQRAADVKGLFERFARMRGLEASFREEKQLALLAVPLKSSGKLYFLPPSHLARVVLEPRPSSVIIGPDSLRMLDDGVLEVIDLRANAELNAFITSLVHVFSGDRAALERSYQVRYELDSEDESRWSLTLEPRAKPLTEMLRYLRLVGSGASVSSIEMKEPKGDLTVTSVVSSDAKREFTKEEKAELFGIQDSDSK